MNKFKILYIRGFKLATCKEWELVVPGFPCSRDHRPCNISKATELSPQVSVFSSISCKYSLGRTNRMIPPNISVVKYDNPGKKEHGQKITVLEGKFSCLLNMASSGWPFVC